MEPSGEEDALVLEELPEVDDEPAKAESPVEEATPKAKAEAPAEEVSTVPAQEEPSGQGETLAKPEPPAEEAAPKVEEEPAKRTWKALHSDSGRVLPGDSEPGNVDGKPNGLASPETNIPTAVSDLSSSNPDWAADSPSTQGSLSPSGPPKRWATSRTEGAVQKKPEAAEESLSPGSLSPGSPPEKNTLKVTDDVMLPFARWAATKWDLMAQVLFDGIAVAERLQRSPRSKVISFLRSNGFAGNPSKVYDEIESTNRARDDRGTIGLECEEKRSITLPQFQNYRRRCTTLISSLPMWDASSPSHKFILTLRRKRGCLLRAWRMDLDLQGVGRVGIKDFVTVCRRLDMVKVAKQIWRSLRPNGSQTPLEFREMDSEESWNLEEFREALWNNAGFHLEKVWASMDTSGRGFISLQEFQAGAKKLGFEGDSELLFRGLASFNTDESVGTGRLWQVDFEYVRVLSLAAVQAPRSSPLVKVLQTWVEEEFCGASNFFHDIGFTSHCKSMDISTLGARLASLGFPGEALEVAAVFAHVGADGSSQVLKSSLQQLLPSGMKQSPNQTPQGTPDQKRFAKADQMQAQLTKEASKFRSTQRGNALESSPNGAQAEASTSLNVAVAAGTSTLPVASHAGFKLGRQIVIDPGPLQEVNEVAKFGSIILKYPLKIAHPAGICIIMYKEQAPKAEWNTNTDIASSNTKNCMGLRTYFSVAKRDSDPCKPENVRDTQEKPKRLQTRTAMHNVDTPVEEDERRADWDDSVYVWCVRSRKRVLGLEEYGRQESRRKRTEALTAAEEAMVDDLLHRIWLKLDGKKSRTVDLFRKIDTNSSGGCDYEEFRDGLHWLGLRPSEREFQGLMLRLDVDQDAEICLAEFDKALKDAERRLAEPDAPTVTQRAFLEMSKNTAPIEICPGCGAEFQCTEDLCNKCIKKKLLLGFLPAPETENVPLTPTEEMLLKIVHQMNTRKYRPSDFFRTMDLFGRGAILVEELQDGLRKVGLSPQEETMSAEEFDLVRIYFDSGSGIVSGKEFQEAAKLITKKVKQQGRENELGTWAGSHSYKAPAWSKHDQGALVEGKGKTSKPKQDEAQRPAWARQTRNLALKKHICVYAKEDHDPLERKARPNGEKPAAKMKTVKAVEAAKSAKSPQVASQGKVSPQSKKPSTASQEAVGVGGKKPQEKSPKELLSQGASMPAPKQAASSLSRKPQEEPPGTATQKKTEISSEAPSGAMPETKVPADDDSSEEEEEESEEEEGDEEESEEEEEGEAR